MSSMNAIGIRQCFLGALTFLACLLAIALYPTQAKANVVCSVDNAEVNFGSSDAGVGSIDYTCTNYGHRNITFNVCVDLGFPSWPGTAAQPVLRKFPNFIDYNLFEDAANSSPWVRGQPLTQTVSIPGGVGRSQSGSIQFYGLIAPGQSPPAGSYQAFFFFSSLGISPGNSGQCRINQANFSGDIFTLSVYKEVINECLITSVADANLGMVAAGAGPVSGMTSLIINCPDGTPFNIGLLPSNGNTQGLGNLSGSPGNGDQPQYQLRSGSAVGPIWGNTASQSSTGNGVTGVGTGNDQDYPIYVTVPDTNVIPDSYRDTVRVTVHF